jgi:hypothetical protein
MHWNIGCRETFHTWRSSQIGAEMAKKKSGSAGTAAAVRQPKRKRGNGAQKLKQKKKR